MKKTLVSFLAIVAVLALVATVNAAPVTSDMFVKVDGVNAHNDNVAVIAGEEIPIAVRFTSLVDATDVRIKAELEGEKNDISVRSSLFDVEAGEQYREVLTIDVPFDLDDEVSNDLTLTVKIWNDDDKTEQEFRLRVQRPSYNPEVILLNVPSNVEAGEKFPVDIVLKNRGYNELDDLIVTARIASLGVEHRAYFDDLVPVEYCDGECDEDEEDTVSGRLNLMIPYDVDAGLYTLEVEVVDRDEEGTDTVTRQIAVGNDLADNVFATSTAKTVSAGEDAEYTLVIVNPTDKVKVYRIVTEASGDLSTNTNPSVVAVPAGSSETVKVTANSRSEGDYTFAVTVLSGDEVVSTVNLSTKVQGLAVGNVTSPIVLLTIILAIIFIVLLIVLVALVTRKPNRTEEFGESYY